MIPRQDYRLAVPRSDCYAQIAAGQFPKPKPITRFTAAIANQSSISTVYSYATLFTILIAHLTRQTARSHE